MGVNSRIGKWANEIQLVIMAWDFLLLFCQSQLPVKLPVLYIRGEKENGNIQDYVNGLQKSGLRHVTGKLIPDCGHFSAEEKPALVAKTIHEFIVK